MATSVLLFALMVACAVSKAYCQEPSGNDTIKEFCMKETDTPKDLVDSYEEKAEEVEPKEELYCYVKCVFEEIDVIDEEGSIQIKEFMELIPEADEDCLKKLPKIIECADMKALDTCA